MQFTIHHYHHTVADASTAQKLDAILHKLGAVMASLDDIIAAVTAESTEIASVETLIEQLRQQVAGLTNGNLPADVQAKVDAAFADVQKNASALATAIASPGSAPTPTTSASTSSSSSAPASPATPASAPTPTT